MAADETSANRSRLLELPPELRLRIYEMLRDDDSAFVKRLEPHLFRKCDMQPSAFTLPITRVNRELRNESIPILYGAVVLMVSFHPKDNLEKTKEWLDIVDTRAFSYIRNFTMYEFEHSCSFDRVSIQDKCNRILTDRDGKVFYLAGRTWACCGTRDAERRERVQLVRREWDTRVTKQSFLTLLERVEAFEMGGGSGGP